jgi:hypothetical protein
VRLSTDTTTILGLLFLAGSCAVYSEDLLEEGGGNGGETGTTSVTTGTGGMGAFGGMGGVGPGGGGATTTGNTTSSTGGSTTSSTSSTGGMGGSGGNPIPELWINELHYDNNGSDADEGVEVAGTAGGDLSGYSVVLYNGSNGMSYGTVSLTGTLPNQGGGVGAAWFPKASIQNGAPDGLALVGPGDVVIQFLSYEGAFTAANGPANGMMSTDIAVEEPDTLPLGRSLQLTGNGATYASFTWAVPATATPGAVNTGQTFQ